MLILVTGVAGFIGSHVAQALLRQNHEIIGIDNLNAYYDPKLKLDRLEGLGNQPNFEFIEGDIAEPKTFERLARKNEIGVIIHLAAQAGVRYSITNPFEYAHSNLIGHLTVLEFARNLKTDPLLIYASSSSVYGNNLVAPFSEAAALNQPVSLYAATKLADEMMSYCYAHLYGLRQIGLRFFTVYGPWGRPDMAYWDFSEAILAGRPIQVFNHGDMMRDFTYIDDIVEGIVRIASQEPVFPIAEPPHKVYNIGNNQPVKLLEFIATLENALGKKAEMEYLPMQAGDVYETSADITALQRDYGFAPNTPLAKGLQKFADWYLAWRKI
ncbi:MAG: NAD-dependent epimerase/dehydratase family protein [Pseudomonadota bacterium]